MQTDLAVELEDQTPVTEATPAAKPQRTELASPELFDRISKGDESALAALYDRAGRVVFGLAVRMLRDEAEAEEVMIDVFMQVWRKAGDFDPSRGTPTAWLLMVARSRVIDRLRSRQLKRDSEQPIDQIEILDRSPGPEEHFFAGHVGRRVREALALLSSEQRLAIELAFFEGLTHSEVAIRLRAPLGTIKTRIRSGMLRLRELFEQTGTAGALQTKPAVPACLRRS